MLRGEGRCRTPWGPAPSDPGPGRLAQRRGCGSRRASLAADARGLSEGKLAGVRPSQLRVCGHSGQGRPGCPLLKVVTGPTGAPWGPGLEQWEVVCRSRMAPEMRGCWKERAGGGASAERPHSVQQARTGLEDWPAQTFLFCTPSTPQHRSPGCSPPKGQVPWLLPRQAVLLAVPFPPCRSPGCSPPRTGPLAAPPPGRPPGSSCNRSPRQPCVDRQIHKPGFLAEQKLKIIQREFLGCVAEAGCTRQRFPPHSAAGRGGRLGAATTLPGRPRGAR